MKNTFKVAIVQERQHPYDRKWNTEKGLSIIKEAKKQDADIVLFPECWITGYEFPSVDERLSVEEIMNTEQFKKWNELALQDDSKYIQAFWE